MTKTPAPPKGIKASGRRLWDDVLGRFDLDEHEVAVLRETVRTVDQLDDLAGIVAADGVMLGDKVHPALVEQRQLRIVLSRLVASLRLPDEDDQRPQHRGSARGAYQPQALPLRGV